MEGKSLALLVLSGKQEGRLLPLQPGTELFIGRMEGMDLVLSEDLVSRRHACVEVREEGAILRDLGSTNGTFVNGKRIREVALREGDRILLGATILSVVPNEEMILTGASLTEVLAGVSAGPPLEEGADGDPTVASVREGASLAGAATPDVDGESAFADAESAAGAPLPDGADEEEPDLPDDAELVLAEMAPPWRALDPQELDVLQIALVARRVGSVLERAAHVPDARAVLRVLIDKGYLRLVDD